MNPPRWLRRWVLRWFLTANDGTPVGIMDEGTVFFPNDGVDFVLIDYSTWESCLEDETELEALGERFDNLKKQCKEMGINHERYYDAKHEAEDLAHRLFSAETKLTETEADLTVFRADYRDLLRRRDEAVRTIRRVAREVNPEAGSDLDKAARSMLCDSDVPPKTPRPSGQAWNNECSPS